MKNVVRAIFTLILAATMLIAGAGCQSNAGKTLANTGSFETVKYGTYAQAVVTDAGVIAQLENAQWSGNRTKIGETTYEKVVAAPYRERATFTDGTEIVAGQTYYFTVMPIEWYVLNEADGHTVLMSKYILDETCFQTNTETDNQGNYPNNWSLSVLRTWLNDTFYNTAFNSVTGAAINTTKIVSKHPESFYKSHSQAIADTWDKVYALSYAEATSTALSFTSEKSDYDCLRMAKPTDYARAKGAWYYVANATEGSADYEREMAFDGNGEYWLRTVGQDILYAGIVRYTGEVGPVYKYVDYNAGVRPVINLGV